MDWIYFEEVSLDGKPIGDVFINRTKVFSVHAEEKCVCLTLGNNWTLHVKGQVSEVMEKMWVE